jgi:hypothetical protein
VDMTTLFRWNLHYDSGTLSLLNIIPVRLRETDRHGRSNLKHAHFSKTWRLAPEEDKTTPDH